jgi:putative peptidoglycan lipid II flippase
LSLFLWSAQSIYSRAFYAAGNTFVPMLAGTVITLISLPMYAWMYRAFGAMGLAIASDLGIGMQTLTIAVLLHKRRMVSLAGLDYEELGRCLLAGIGSSAAVWTVFDWLLYALGLKIPAPSRWAELAVLVAGTALWALVADGILRMTGSALPRVLRKRLGIA